MPRSRPAMTAAERQAKRRARLRALTPLERALERPASAIYTAQELAILAEIRRLEAELKARTGRLNAMLQARMTTAADDPSLSAADRREAELALAELVAERRLVLASF